MKKFAFKIQNTGGSDKVIALLPGQLNTMAVSGGVLVFNDKTELNTYGVPVDGVLIDGTIITDVTGTAKSASATIRHFLDYVKANPLMLQELTVEANNKDVFEEEIYLRQGTPLDGTGDKQISLTDYLNTMQVQDTKVNIPLGNLPVGNNTIMWMNIPAGRTVNFNFKF